MASDFAQLVKQQADIVRVVGEYITLKKSGAQNYAGLCPFHGEKTASFSVHAVRQFYHCFGCNEGGDVFSFVQKIENVGFTEAVKVVAKKCGIALPKREFASAASCSNCTSWPQAGSRNSCVQPRAPGPQFNKNSLKR